MANSLPDATGYSGALEVIDTSRIDVWEPLRAEIPLDPLEAFRLASFGIEYVPQYAPLFVDAQAQKAARFDTRRQWPVTLPKVDGAYVLREVDPRRWGWVRVE